jgi:hypothetical protein
MPNLRLISVAAIGIILSVGLSLLANSHVWPGKVVLLMLGIFYFPSYLLANLLLGPIHNLAEGQRIQYLAAFFNALLYSGITYLILRRVRPRA